jgi:hypothetical protein
MSVRPGSYDSSRSSHLLAPKAKRNRPPLFVGSRLRYWLCSPPNRCPSLQGRASWPLPRVTFVFLSRLYFDRLARRARTPGGIHLWLLEHYEHVAMWPTSSKKARCTSTGIICKVHPFWSLLEVAVSRGLVMMACDLASSPDGYVHMIFSVVLGLSPLRSQHREPFSPTRQRALRKGR